MNKKLIYSLGALAFLAWSGLAKASDPTAFALIKAADQYVGEQSKDKVVQIRSERSVGSMVPRIWYVVYYDPDAKMTSIEVKFGAGQKMDVSRPMRPLERGADKVLDAAELKVDSDKALSKALSQPLLKGLTMTSSQFWLQHSPDGPRWRIRLWAAKLAKPGEQVSIGDVYISSADGSVVKLDLHPERVN